MFDKKREEQAKTSWGRNVSLQKGVGEKKKNEKSTIA